MAAGGCNYPPERSDNAGTVGDERSRRFSEDIDMSIEEAILHCRENAEKERENCNYGCAEEHEQLAKWLEELKNIKEGEEK